MSGRTKEEQILWNKEYRLAMAAVDEIHEAVKARKAGLCKNGHVKKAGREFKGVNGKTYTTCLACDKNRKQLAKAKRYGL